ncbi:electron transfer flavoprotein subunit beta/FixA family protein [Desulforhopalus singaporensis]|uniref:Electron transfer flavoprotein beta subunit n=1 Tax=Desulforhopalus singaporensis TaxID=91360 RepID=A0A1H0RZK6_9BACT|nr:electron transfer flavoprotein subunit beta/FixA family protein [Desulforhopalus singaporensis]SDP34446.1 electron transfer flavoprotein beta subunit [Desulforhopalus singaporensis]
MRIYVCIKQVPDSEAIIKIVGDTEYNREVVYVVNPYDEYGVEEAVRLKENNGDGEVIAVCVGGEGAVSALRTVMAMGVDRSVLVKTGEQFVGSDLTAQALAWVIEQEGPADIIFAGKQSMDSEGMQTPYRLGAQIGLPVVSNVVNFSLEKTTALVQREMGGGLRESLTVKTPCIIGANKGLNEPRYPKMHAILKAKKKEIKVLDIAELTIQDNSGVQLKGLHPAEDRSEARILEGTAEEAVSSLVDILAEQRII